MKREQLNKLMAIKAKEKKTKSYASTINCTFITIIC